MGKIEYVLHSNNTYFIYFYDNDGFIIGAYNSHNFTFVELSEYCNKCEINIIYYLNHIGINNVKYVYHYYNKKKY